jgi:3',5'-cyclic AMP phosphodiesterase CpdA
VSGGRLALAFALAAGAAALLASCAAMPYRRPPGPEVSAALRSAPPWPSVRFAVVSDLHYFDPSLGTTGPDLRAYIAEDRKMLVESPEILAEAIGIVRGSGVRFLLVTGDLTKDGERVDHEEVAGSLGALAAAGIAVYVIPGNHDIDNPDAVRFTEDGAEPVERVTPQQFAAIYRDCGYGQAIARDPGSLSYVAEPVAGLWLLGIDACRYGDERSGGSARTGGRLGPGSLRWIQERLAEAARRGARVIAFMHHGVVEHFRGQEQYAARYLVDDHREVARMLAAWGVQVVFTGHFHAQDVTRASFPDGSRLYDVETGSLVTTPMPIRFAETDASGRMTITTARVDGIPSFRAAGIDLQAYAARIAREAAVAVAASTMEGYGVPKGDADRLAPQIADAFVAHLQGDEHFTGGQSFGMRGLTLMGRLAVGSRTKLVDDLWTDLPPDDNNLTLELAGAEEGGQR